MNEEERKNHCYLGDGVYAEFDGYGIWLRTGNHEDHLCTNRIYIEPSVHKNFIDFLVRLKLENKNE